MIRFLTYSIFRRDCTFLFPSSVRSAPPILYKEIHQQGVWLMERLLLVRLWFALSTEESAALAINGARKAFE